VGTIIGLEKGPESDEFFLTFDVLGSHRNVRLDPVPLAPAPPPDVRRAADVGLRVFDEVNATMSELTGVSATNPAVKATYDSVKQALPTVENIDTFVSGHPVAVAQLSIQYCNALVDDVSARAAYFPGFDFGAAPASAFGAAGRAVEGAADAVAAYASSSTSPLAKPWYAESKKGRSLPSLITCMICCHCSLSRLCSTLRRRASAPPSAISSL